jgi:hypothetical protein
MGTCKLCLEESGSGGRSRLVGLAVLSAFVVAAVLLNLHSLYGGEIGGEGVYRGVVSRSPVQLAEGKLYTGEVLADLDCRSLGRGAWVRCTAVIFLDGFQEPVHFTYEHDMSVQPCLGPGDRVSLVVEGSGATVKVER